MPSTTCLKFLYPLLWPFQQLGALVVGPIVAVVALVLRRYWLALAALIVTIAKLVSERAVKALVSRQRPYTSIGPRHRSARRRQPRRGELRLGPRHPRRRAGRCRDAVPPAALATGPVGARRRWSWWPASTSGRTTRSTSSAASRSASPSPPSSTSCSVRRVVHRCEPGRRRRHRQHRLRPAVTVVPARRRLGVVVVCGHGD